MEQLAGQIHKSRPQVASVLLRVGETIFQRDSSNFSVGFAEALQNRASQRCRELLAVVEMALANVALERRGNGIKKLKVGGEPLLARGLGIR